MVWVCLAALCLVSFLLWRHQGAFVPLSWPVCLLIGDLVAFFFVRYGIEAAWVRRSFLFGGLLVGFVYVLQAAGKYQVYFLKWGFRPLTLDTYAALAHTIRRFLWLRQLPPASVALDPRGRLTFDQNSSPHAQALMLECEEDLSDLDHALLKRASQQTILVHFLVMGLVLLIA